MFCCHGTLDLKKYMDRNNGFRLVVNLQSRACYKLSNAYIVYGLVDGKQFVFVLFI